MTSMVRIAHAGGCWSDAPEAPLRQIAGGPLDDIVLCNTLGGGGTLSLRVDHRGKTLAQGRLTMQQDVPEDVPLSVGA